MDREFIQWRPVALLEKFDRDQMNWVRGRTGLLEPDGNTMLQYVKPYETQKIVGNLLTTAGLTHITGLLRGTGTGFTTQTNSRIGVGNNATAAVVGDTELGATTADRFYKTLDATFPSNAVGVITWKASFQDTEANFAWQCWGIDRGTTDTNTVVAPLVNRKVQSMGTKTSGIWALTVTLTFS